ncbi:hypothetical protein GQ44DRAFT_771392 [Phaeosphaeriaceae sp. PMI808]|nr:hypothetical protein GQ44DRAFT_771392 [Phaeosphaeriaceae sp. PMI808]
MGRGSYTSNRGKRGRGGYNGNGNDNRAPWGPQSNAPVLSSAPMNFLDTPPYGYYMAPVYNQANPYGTQNDCPTTSITIPSTQSMEAPPRLQQDISRSQSQHADAADDALYGRTGMATSMELPVPMRTPTNTLNHSAFHVTSPPMKGYNCFPGEDKNRPTDALIKNSHSMFENLDDKALLQLQSVKADVAANYQRILVDLRKSHYIQQVSSEEHRACLLSELSEAREAELLHENNICHCYDKFVQKMVIACEQTGESKEDTQTGAVLLLKIAKQQSILANECREKVFRHQKDLEILENLRITSVNAFTDAVHNVVMRALDEAVHGRPIVGADQTQHAHVQPMVMANSNQIDQGSSRAAEAFHSSTNLKEGHQATEAMTPFQSAIQTPVSSVFERSPVSEHQSIGEVLARSQDMDEIEQPEQNTVLQGIDEVRQCQQGIVTPAEKPTSDSPKKLYADCVKNTPEKSKTLAPKPSTESNGVKSGVTKMQETKTFNLAANYHDAITHLLKPSAQPPNAHQDNDKQGTHTESKAPVKHARTGNKTETIGGPTKQVTQNQRTDKTKEQQSTPATTDQSTKRRRKLNRRTKKFSEANAKRDGKVGGDRSVDSKPDSTTSEVRKGG